MTAQQNQSDGFCEMWTAGVSIKDMAKSIGIPRWRVVDSAKSLSLPPRWMNMADKIIDAPLDPIGDDDLDHDTAKGMWVAVLNQAVRDAVWWGNNRPKFGWGVAGNLDWFDSKDAEIVCERAGFNIERLRPAVQDLRARFIAESEAGRRPRNIVAMTAGRGGAA